MLALDLVIDMPNKIGSFCKRIKSYQEEFLRMVKVRVLKYIARSLRNWTIVESVTEIEIRLNMKVKKLYVQRSRFQPTVETLGLEASF